MTAVVSGRRWYAQWTVQSSSRIVAAAPHDPGDVPRQERPRREQRQHPRRVDVRQERAGRVVRVAAVEPDPDARPVRPGVGAGRLAAADHAGGQQREGQAEQDDRDDAAVVAQARRLAPHRPPVDAGPPAGRGPEHVREVHHEAAAPPRRPGDRVEFRRVWRIRVGHRAGILARLRSAVRVSFPESRRESSQVVTEGSVIIIGGAEDKVRDRVILSRFATLAGGRDANVVVISTASSLGVEAGERYKQVLGELGVTKVRTIHAVTRAQANDEKAALAIRNATGIFLTGGNQLRLSSTIGGTRLADAVLDQFRQGAVVAGTSAGASAHVQPHDRVRGVRRDAEAPHGPDRGRARRAARASSSTSTSSSGTGSAGCSASSPRTRACSASASTRTRPGSSAPDHVMEVIGRGSITVVDGARSETDAWEVKGHRPLMISGVVLHSLPAGYRFDLRRRERIVAPALHALPGGEAASS